MTSFTYLIPALIFGVTLIVVLGIAVYASRLKRRQTLLRKIEEEGFREKETLPLNFKDRVRQTFLRLTGSLGRAVQPKQAEDISQFRKRLMQAGLSRFRNVVVVFYGTKVLLAILLPAFFAFFQFALFARLSPLVFILFMIILMIVGFLLPELWLTMRIRKRKDQIARGFPDGLDLMVICTEAGMGLDSTLNRVGEEMKLRHPAMSEELKILNLELKAGKLRRDALRNLAMRCDSEDVQGFATLLIQTEKFGTNVAQAMRVLADSMRVKRTQRIEQKAATLAIKILFPTILLIFPSLFLVLMGPAMLSAYRAWRGY